MDDRRAEAAVWRPSREAAAATNVMRFARSVGVDDYPELLVRSQRRPEWFWDAVVRALGIDFARPYERVMDDSQGPEWTRWFVGGRLNVAWNCAGKWAERTPDATAVRAETEDGRARSLSYLELWRRTCRLGAGLR